jgi:hypothetical protein
MAGEPHGIPAGIPIRGNEIPLVAGVPIPYIHKPFGQIEAKSVGATLSAHRQKPHNGYLS